MTCTKSELDIVINSANNELNKLNHQIKIEVGELLKDPSFRDIGQITYLMINYRDQYKRRKHAQDLINKYHKPAAR